MTADLQGPIPPAPPAAPPPPADKPGQDPLKIEVAPNIVEHLGLNLYTNLPRVLVEYVANAFDADSKYANIKIDCEAIAKARDEMRAQWKARQENKDNRPDERPLGEQTLPDNFSIEIEDRGHGMSRDDLQSKFLRIARKRRSDKKAGEKSDGGGRFVMGRKGIGKLAGFGIARKIEIVTRTKGQDRAIRIALDYDKLTGHETTATIGVDEEVLKGTAGLEPNGTRIILSKLVFDPAGSHEETITRRVAEHFAILDPAEFEVKLNDKRIPVHERVFVFAYPSPEMDSRDLAGSFLTTEDAKQLPFKYRIRFTGPKKQLLAGERGIRVYARQRLACAPDLLELGTGMHGFQNTHYLDGVVYADFIEDQPADYVASDRHTLRWDAPLLAPLKKFLTDEMRDACIAFQGGKEKTIAKKVLEDEFTKETIEKWDLPPHRKEVAFRIAAKLASGCPDQMEDDYYRQTLPVLVKGLGYGELLAAIAEISKKEGARLDEVVVAIAELTKSEWDDYSKIVAGRLKGIKGLRRIYSNIDFSSPKNEEDLHSLLKDNPWLIDPTFWQFLTSNVTEKTLSAELSKHIEVAGYAPEKYDKSVPDEKDALQTNKRPDLTFLLSSFSIQRVVIVELKAPNTPLHNDHLTQLETYMAKTEEFLEARSGKGRDLKVEGYLIGTKDRGAAKNDKVKLLASRMKKRAKGELWQVMDIGELLERAEDAHRELLDVYEAAAKKAEEAKGKAEPK